MSLGRNRRGADDREAGELAKSSASVKTQVDVSAMMYVAPEPNSDVFEIFQGYGTDHGRVKARA